MAASGDPTSYYVVSFISTIMLFVVINANFAVDRELNRLPERGHLWIIHARQRRKMVQKKTWGGGDVSKLETLNLSFLQSFFVNSFF